MPLQKSRPTDSTAGKIWFKSGASQKAHLEAIVALRRREWSRRDSWQPRGSQIAAVCQQLVLFYSLLLGLVAPALAGNSRIKAALQT
jgi:hypothetical protein